MELGPHFGRFLFYIVILCIQGHAGFLTGMGPNIIMNHGIRTQIFSSLTSLSEWGFPMLTTERRWYVVALDALARTERLLKSTTQEAAEDVAAFVAIFFDHFHQFKGRAFHMAGESYGVRVSLMDL
jgi:hypothetical protein